MLTKKLKRMTKKIKNQLIEEIRNEVKDFYNLSIEDKIIEDFIGWYFKGNNPVFDTTEREDFILHLEDLGLIVSVKLCS